MSGVGPVPSGPDDDPLAGLQIPDDLSELDDEVPSVALVVTPVADPAPLAATCALAKVDVDAVPSDVGAIAVLRDPGAGERAAAAISELLRAVPVVLLERREQQVSATHWVGGERTRDLPPGLVLSDAPELLENLLLGGLRAADVPGTVTSVGMTRWKALRTLAGRRSRD
ncbi:hypothetical protein [Cellulomonas sp. 73-145]|uniref:hypothetical protein n=1 Tax=Cellulomonas sp. 73-145 TaxID=1895739 RepID=UPI000AFEC46A|nr:hypothetical protein [Cellulomonas sp. 73-145]